LGLGRAVRAPAPPDQAAHTLAARSAGGGHHRPGSRSYRRVGPAGRRRPGNAPERHAGANAAANRGALP